MPEPPTSEPEETQPDSEERGCMLFVLSVFALICLIAGYAAEMFGPALAVFAGIGAIYVLLVRAKFFNAIEAAVVCLINLVLILLLIPAIGKVREAAKRLREKESSCLDAPALGGRMGAGGRHEPHDPDPA